MVYTVTYVCVCVLHVVQVCFVLECVLCVGCGLVGWQVAPLVCDHEALHGRVGRVGLWVCMATASSTSMSFTSKYITICCRDNPQ